MPQRDRENFPIDAENLPGPHRDAVVVRAHARGANVALSAAVRVIVVDDKPAMAETIVDSLIDRGFDATAFVSGRVALDAVRAGGVDLVVTDLRMPDLDGLQLLDAVRALGVPVIIMTAYGAIDSAIEAIRRGALQYLTKPFKLDELVDLIRRANELVTGDQRP